MDGLVVPGDPSGTPAIHHLRPAVLFVYLALAAQYESWSMPLAIILIVPMCLLSAILGVWSHGSDVNILTQIGFVVLVGLAAKNAILIVEFAAQLEAQGRDRFQAAVRGLPVALAANSDDLVRFYARRRALIYRDGRGVRDAGRTRDRRVLWDAGRHLFRADFHAGILRRDP